MVCCSACREWFYVDIEGRAATRLPRTEARLSLWLTCPDCGHDSVADVRSLAGLLTCPHCRQTVFASAKKMLAGTEARSAQEAVSRLPPAEEGGAGAPFKPNRWAIAAVVVGLLAAVAAAVMGWPAWSGKSRSRDGGVSEITRDATTFTQAWLRDDIETAATLVESQDSDLLKRWWLHSRSVWLANVTQAEVTAVQVVPVDPSRAYIRVQFSTPANSRETSQTWKKTAAGWRFNPEAALSAFVPHDE